MAKVGLALVGPCTLRRFFGEPARVDVMALLGLFQLQRLLEGSPLV